MNVDEVARTIEEAFVESRLKLKHVHNNRRVNNVASAEVLPGIVDVIRCIDDRPSSSTSGAAEVWATWDQPWNVEPSKSKQLRYSVFVGGGVDKEYIALSQSMVIPGFSKGQTVKFFVRALLTNANDTTTVYKGEYSHEHSCVAK